MNKLYLKLTMCLISHVTCLRIKLEQIQSNKRDKILSLNISIYGLRIANVFLPHGHHEQFCYV